MLPSCRDKIIKGYAMLIDVAKAFLMDQNLLSEWHGGATTDILPKKYESIT